MTQIVARLIGELVASPLDKKELLEKGRIISDILPMILGHQQRDVLDRLTVMKLADLKLAFARASEARKGIQNVVDQDIASTKAVLSIPRLVQS